jgi:uncharacterized membrane protein YeaQ/YmgE (transglycosylase-associated protein family)
VEEKEVKVNVRVTVVKLLNYAAIAAVIVGLLYGILAAVGSEGASGSARFANFLQGFFYAIVGGAVLAGLSELVSRKE